MSAGRFEAARRDPLSRVRPSPVPASALLQPYCSGGGYADCFVADVPGTTSLESFVDAFYTTPLFKVERALLRWLAARPSTDQAARDLATGASSQFAAWTVEGRTPTQLLLADFTHRTRSWLMVDAVEGLAGAPATRLYFGSAVIPRKDRRTGRGRMGIAFHAMLGFHKLYSRLLLRAALARLQPGS